MLQKNNWLNVNLIHESENSIKPKLVAETFLSAWMVPKTCNFISANKVICSNCVIAMATFIKDIRTIKYKLFIGATNLI